MSRPVAKPDGISKWRSKALEERIARADAASADIKSFNEYVNRHGHRSVVLIDVPGETREKIGWQPMTADTWGLTHHCDVESAGGKTRKATPLIECTMSVRLRMAKLLPELLQAIDRAVEKEEYALTPDPEDD